MLVILIFAIIFETTFCSNGQATKKRLVHTTSSDFSETVQTASFVDKTLLIKEFMEGCEMVMLTAPRRFGKSTNMDMIMKFCKITVNEEGNRVPKNETKTNNIFSKNNLKIFQDRVFFDKHFGNYPVIHLDFKELSCSSYKGFISSFRELVRKAYARHKYLLFSSKLDKEDIFQFNKYYEENKIDRLEDEKVKNSIQTLTGLLYNHFNRTKCIVFIDEFDGPIQKAINKAGSEVSKIFDFIMEFISTVFKSNTYAGRALINACVRLTGLLTTDANNIKHIPFLSHPKFSKFYGLTESEVQYLLKRFNMSHQINEVRLWYDGYKELGTNDTIYNVYAIVNYLESRKLKSYWAESGGVKDIARLFAHHLILNKVERLMEDFNNKRKGIKIEYREKITVDDVEILRELSTQHKVTNSRVHLFLQYLTEQGYFNILREGTGYAYICIPNKEIEAEIQQTITTRRFYEYKFKTNYVSFEKIAEHFKILNERNHTYIELIKCIETVYQDETVMPYNEHALQRDIVSSCDMSGLFERVETEESVNGKRLDILLITNEKAIIIELKNDWKRVYAALGQRVENKFHNILDGKNYKITIFLGLKLSKERQCSISYLVQTATVIDSTNINTAYNVTNLRRPTVSAKPTRRKFTRRTGYTHKPHTRIPRITFQNNL